MNNPACPAAARLPRRRALAAAATAGAAALLGACSSGTASRSLSTASGGAGPLTIGMTYTPNVQFAPFYMSVYADGTQLRHLGTWARCTPTGTGPSSSPTSNSSSG